MTEQEFNELKVGDIVRVDSNYDSNLHRVEEAGTNVFGQRYVLTRCNRAGFRANHSTSWATGVFQTSYHSNLLLEYAPRMTRIA
jgi:hypothetical protein